MSAVESDLEPAAGQTQSETADDFYKRTRFWPSARRYGFSSLTITWGTAGALLAGGGVLWLYLDGQLKSDGLKALGVAYISLGAALFGIVLAGFAVVAAFFDRDYVSTLREFGTLEFSLFGYWWVAALAVVSLIASVALTVAVYADAVRSVTAVAVTIATVLFISALLEALALVGTLMRHGLYRAELMARDIRITRRGQ